MRAFLKSLAERVPYSLGHHLARVPFSLRLGSDYTRFSEIVASGTVDEDYIVRHFSAVFEHAKQRFPFYRDFYSDAGVLNLRITTLEDIQRVPVLSKERIRDHVDEFSGALRLNTGGTSGKPFVFYVDKNAFAREWAHMHAIWKLRGYHYRDVKLTLRGRDLGDRPYIYNPVHNEFALNTYLPVARYVDDLIALVQRHAVRFMHGYPSSIYTFLKELEDCATPAQADAFREQMRCCMLGSEFPVPYMADYINDAWGLDYISWYGHSEMCILAYDENSTNVYRPFQSYGYAEVVEGRLVGTSYHNFDMPLIRYDTADGVTADVDSRGLLQTFTISEGRQGDFVVDRNGKHITLTALVFGRHHKLFEHADCLQLRQPEPGKVEFLVTGGPDMTAAEALALLDLSNVDIEFSVTMRDQPVLTAAGKMPLKVS